MAAKSKLHARPLSILSLSLTIVLAMSGCQSATDGGNQLSANGSGGTGSGGSTPPSGGGGGGGSPPTGSSQVALDWDSPTTNVDQTCLTNLSGYVISYGTSPGTYTYQETVPVSSLTCTNTSTVTACGTVQTCTHTVVGLSQGQWYFSAAAYNADLVTSPASNEATITIN
jgi:hypothetical protein